MESTEINRQMLDLFAPLLPYKVYMDHSKVIFKVPVDVLKTLNVKLIRKYFLDWKMEMDLAFNASTGGYNQPEYYIFHGYFYSNDPHLRTLPDSQRPGPYELPSA